MVSGTVFFHTRLSARTKPPIFDPHHAANRGTTCPTPVGSSGVAQSYFSPRKITLRYALIAGFKFFHATSNACARIRRQQNTIDRQAAGIPLQGKTRQVIKNQWSDNTRRRSRDMPPSRFLKSVVATRHFSFGPIPQWITMA